MDSELTYISLFSGAGIGCFGFQEQGFSCIATNEIREERLKIQSFNRKCPFDSGYVCGDITEKAVQDRILAEVEHWKQEKKIRDVTVLIATPPCQGMSVANHKKSANEMQRNSLVVESLKMTEEIKPLFFVFENVPSFMKTLCTDVDNTVKPISEAIDAHLGAFYSISSQILNFKNYGSRSSRSRTLALGVRNDIAAFVSPLELFPSYQPEQTLREVIGDFAPLPQFGAIDPHDIFHAFRTYPEHMRAWISELKEGQSAFEQTDPRRIPHRVEKGTVVFNQNKNADKYRRQYWNRVAPCVHTRNDQLASQNTIHPSEDRVFSIRELMRMMSVPDSFRWTDIPEDRLNALSEDGKRAFLRKSESNIRRCLGEAVPTAVMASVAENIRRFSETRRLSDTEIERLIEAEKLTDHARLLAFLREHLDFGFSTLSKIAEYANAKRERYAAFFTDKPLLTEIAPFLPTLEKEEIRALEPSVGTGNFLPFIMKKYEAAKKLHIDVVDIDPDAMEVLQTLLGALNLPASVSVNFLTADFLTYPFREKYDLVVGNPPFSKLNGANSRLEAYRLQSCNPHASNLSAFFLERALALGDYVSLILPKSLLNTPEFQKTRELLATKRMDSILDFGEKGFRGVLIETVCLNVDLKKAPSYTTVRSVPERKLLKQKQSYICDSKYPYWLLYRDSAFDAVARKLDFDAFTVFRDRQITNRLLSDSGEIRVIKSRNINNDGTEIVSLKGYDSYISKEDARRLSVFSYYEDDTVYLSPNMTYNPRVIRKPKNTLVNGSVAILRLKPGRALSEAQRAYFSTPEYRAFYRTARNYQTRSLNLDSASVFFFGLLRTENDVAPERAAKERSMSE